MITNLDRRSKQSMAVAIVCFLIAIGLIYWSHRPSFPKGLEPLLLAAPVSLLLSYLAFGVSQYFEVKALGRSTILALLLIPMGILGFAITKFLSDKTETLEYIKANNPNHDVLDCPACGAFYRLSDYREDALEIICSACKSVIKKNKKANQAMQCTSLKLGH